MQQGKSANWITFFKGILDTSLGAEFETATESTSAIELLDKTPIWQLKGIVAQITLKMFSK
jgi:hypothetical protein